MKQWPAFRVQPRSRQAGEIADIPPGALDRTETFGPSTRSSRVTYRQQRQTAVAAGPRQRSNTICAGAQDGLHSVQVEHLRRLPMDLHQRFDDRLDGPDCQGSDQTVRFFPRPCDERAQTRVLHPIRCPR